MEKLLAAVKELASADGHDCVIVEEGGGVWRVAVTTDEELDDGGRANACADLKEDDFKSVKDLKATASKIYADLLAA